MEETVKEMLALQIHANMEVVAYPLQIRIMNVSARLDTGEQHVIIQHNVLLVHVMVMATVQKLMKFLFSGVHVIMVTLEIPVKLKQNAMVLELVMATAHVLMKHLIL